MFHLPSFRELTSVVERDHFAKTYTACSGLAVPKEFARAATNQFFGLYAGDQLVGGFILGHGPDFRTIAVFAGENTNRTSTIALVLKTIVPRFAVFLSRKLTDKTPSTISLPGQL